MGIIDPPRAEAVSYTHLASGAAQEQVHALVNEGLLQPQGHGPQDWLFAGDALPRTRRALRLARDFGLDLAAEA